MPDVNGQPERINWHLVDTFALRFEEAWHKGKRPAIGDYLPIDGSERLLVLQELVCIDIEWRLRAGEDVQADDYVNLKLTEEDLADVVRVIQAHFDEICPDFVVGS